MRRKRIIAFLLGILLSTLFVTDCFAKEVENEKIYKPLDLVVVIDSSGSMNTSDTSRTALDAVRMLVNMMPAKDSRVGIVGFNTEATVLTKNPSGKNALISLEDFTGVETIRTDVSTIVYSGGTGIGNAVKAATDLLNSNSDDEHTKAIILFTDGVNDFGYDRIALSACEDNEVDAVKWAKRNNCYIYCVGYDYVTSSGVSSMGTGGEGLKKLQNIADSTGGVCKAINSISDIEQLLIDFLADVCELNYKTIATIPGDGGFHECIIPVSPSVIEANIRIAGGGTNAIKYGKIRLYDPVGKEIKLANSGNVRFDTDATAASIKVIMPKAGDWRLTVEGINGEDIHVGLLEHFKMNLTSQLVFPDGNPDGVAYTNDVIGIKTWLTYEDADLENDEIYDAVTSATAVCVSRANKNDKKTITLTRDGRSFVGSFVIPEDSYYDITIRLDWDTVYREDTLTVMSSNTPVKLVKDIDDIKVNKGKTITIDDIYQYVHDEENDPIEVSLKSVSTTGVADIKFIGDKVDITGVKGWWAKTLVTLEFKDAQGNTVETSFKVSVGDPWAVVLIISILVILIAAVLCILYALYKKTFRVRGKIRIALLEKRSDGKTVETVFEDKSRRFKDPTKSLNNDLLSDDPLNDFGDFGFSPLNEAKEENAASIDGDDTGFGFGFGFDEPSESDTDFDNGTIKDEISRLEIDLANSFSNGEMQLGSIVTKKQDSLYAVLNEFIKRLRYHMSSAGDLENSVLVQKVEDFIKYNFSEFNNIKVLGSRFGRQGIVLLNKSKQPINFMSPRLIKNKLSTKPYGRKLVVIKISIPIPSENTPDLKTEAYIEIEYINN